MLTRGLHEPGTWTGVTSEQATSPTDDLRPCHGRKPDSMGLVGFSGSLTVHPGIFGAVPYRWWG